MLALILGVLVILGVIVAVSVSKDKTPRNLRGYYGDMFWTIAIVAILGVSLVAVVGLLA